MRALNAFRSGLLRTAVGLTLAAAVAVYAQDAASPPPACTSGSHRSFDFWIGEWDVSEGGKVAGRNRIEPILGGCALLESWTGASKSRGTSLNFYDGAEDAWHQTWIDNSGGALYLSGGLQDGSMVLSGRRPPTDGNESSHETLHRITWTPLPGGKIRQHWETSQDDGLTWQTLFDGLYTPSAPGH